MFKISDLIAKLEVLKNRAGDVPIIVARDDEGNGYGVLTEFSFDSYDDCAIMYPSGDYTIPEEALDNNEEG